MASGPLSAPQREELPSWRPPAPLGPESPEDTCPPLQVCELEGTTRLSLWRCPFQGAVSHIRGLGTTGVGGGREPHPQSISIRTGDSWVLQRFQRLDRELQPGRPHPRPRSQLASLHFPAPEGGAQGGGVACAGLGTSIVKSGFTVPGRPGRGPGASPPLIACFHFSRADRETTSKRGRRRVQRRYVQMHRQVRRRRVGPRGQRRPPPSPSACTGWARWPRACWPPPFGYPPLRHRNAACERLSCEGRGGGWPSEQCALALLGGDAGTRAPPRPAPAEALWPSRSQPPHRIVGALCGQAWCFQPGPPCPRQASPGHGTVEVTFLLESPFALRKSEVHLQCPESGFSPPLQHISACSCHHHLPSPPPAQPQK